MEIEKKLKQLLVQRKINQQQWRTYLGQVRSGNVEGCIKGLQRKGLIDADRI